jgi:YbgC/YbaW family acyl-CoA thioester hydrolase
MEFNYTILASELDTEYQHLDHAASLKYLERARLDMLEKIGFPNRSFIEQNLYLVISKIEVRYLREVRAGTISVSCSQMRIDGKEIILKQTLTNEQGKKAIEAEFYLQFLSGVTKRGVLPPEDFCRAFAGC